MLYVCLCMKKTRMLLPENIHATHVKCILCTVFLVMLILVLVFVFTTDSQQLCTGFAFRDSIQLFELQCTSVSVSFKFCLCP